MLECQIADAYAVCGCFGGIVLFSKYCFDQGCLSHAAFANDQ